MKKMRCGFTLVEMSIVLVIIGLITGGVLAGRELIHAAELRKFIREVDDYKVAYNTFRDKYDAIPGDMANATDIWPNGSTGNGNGDGRIEWLIEVTRVWSHLSLAGMVSKQYTAEYYYPNPVLRAGLNAPSSYMNKYAAYYMTDLYSSENFENYGNYMAFGEFDDSGNLNGALSTQDSLNVDTKIDDGKAGTGKMQGSYGYQQILQGKNCIDYGEGGRPTWTYNQSLTGNMCVLYFLGL